MTATITLTPRLARQMAVAAQGLEIPAADSSKEAILDTVRRITCVQLDPINTVARNPLLILWSRLGHYDPADLNALLWDDRVLFEYWAHAASIVPAEDFPLVQPRMVGLERGNGAWGKRAKAWWDDNASFRQYILDEMAARGSLYSNEIEDHSLRSWESSGWSHSRNVSMMLNLMWQEGDITVTRREGKDFGLKKQWGLLAQQLPQWQDHAPWPEQEVTRRAAEKALRALGVGRPRDIKNYFIRGRYPGLEEALAELQSDGRIVPVLIKENDQAWPENWYAHVDNLPLLERLQHGQFAGRTVLLSPFDNLIADRDRAELLFDFHYRIEIYTPKAKRKYGYYVMPILHGDRLVGRIDPQMDRKAGVLRINAVHFEPEIEPDTSLMAGLEETVASLAGFLGAADIEYATSPQQA